MLPRHGDLDMKSGPYFFAWCNEAERVDAFSAALSALVKAEQFGMRAIMDRGSECHTTSVDEVVAMVRAHFGRTDAETYFVAALTYECFVHCIIRQAPGPNPHAPAGNRRLCTLGYGARL